MKQSVFILASSLACAGPVIADTIHVPDDMPTIQLAIMFSLDGDEIVVAPGVYTGEGDAVVDLEGRSIWLHSSDGPEVTIIDCEGLRRGIICQSGEGSGSIIEGFNIRDGKAPWYDWNGNGQQDYWEYFGGGMWCRDGSSPTIRSCHFVNGQSEYGGAICCFDESSSANEPTIENCVFVGNTAGPGVGGAIYSNAGNPEIIGCTFTGNSASYGGAILNIAGSDSVITACAFEDNTASLDAGAIYNDTSMPTITACSFTGNTADDDGGAVFNADPGSSQNIPVFMDCSFMGNSANDDGGAMHNFSVSPILTACTISGNDAASGGGIYSWNGSEPVLAGMQVCGNTPSQIEGPWLDDGDNDVTGSCPGDCPDATGDGLVDVNDILAIVSAYETDDPDADVDGSGYVDSNDILAVLSGWGPC